MSAPLMTLAELMNSDTIATPGSGVSGCQWMSVDVSELHECQRMSVDVSGCQ